MKYRTVTITEHPDRWHITLDRKDIANPMPPWTQTAAEALKAIRKWSREYGESNAIVITWEPTTAIGSLVVKALQ